jgi:hypothetical protein
MLRCVSSMSPSIPLLSSWWCCIPLFGAAVGCFSALAIARRATGSTNARESAEGATGQRAPRSRRRHPPARPRVAGVPSSARALAPGSLPLCLSVGRSRTNKRSHERRRCWTSAGSGSQWAARGRTRDKANTRTHQANERGLPDARYAADSSDSERKFSSTSVNVGRSPIDVQPSSNESGLERIARGSIWRKIIKA